MTMYSQSSPVLSSLSTDYHNHHHQFINASFNSQCLRFKYFSTFIICTVCLGLLSASLATHKWIVSRPIRVLRSNSGQTNFTSLMLTAQSLDEPTGSSSDQARGQRHSPIQQLLSTIAAELRASEQAASQFGEPSTTIIPTTSGQQNNKFQGEIYFGLFTGVKVLNHGFGDRVSQISVFQSAVKDHQQQQQHQQVPISFKLWLTTLLGVLFGLLFALIGSIFAIINFVVTPKVTLAGPIGLVIWNSGACLSCLLAIISWLIEYFVQFQANVLLPEEVTNGWTSDRRSQFGNSFYYVILALILHLVNIFIISIVQFETCNHKAAKRQARAATNCEGVIMLY